MQVLHVDEWKRRHNHRDSFPKDLHHELVLLPRIDAMITVSPASGRIFYRTLQKLQCTYSGRYILVQCVLVLIVFRAQRLQTRKEIIGHFFDIVKISKFWTSPWSAYPKKYRIG